MDFILHACQKTVDPNLNSTLIEIFQHLECWWLYSQGGLVSILLFNSTQPIHYYSVFTCLHKASKVHISKQQYQVTFSLTFARGNIMMSFFTSVIHSLLNLKKSIKFMWFMYRFQPKKTWRNSQKPSATMVESFGNLG